MTTQSETLPKSTHMQATTRTPTTQDAKTNMNKLRRGKHKSKDPTFIQE